MPDEFPTVVRSGEIDNDKIDEHIVLMLVADQQRGIEQMRHYQSGFKIPISIGGYNETINDDKYVVMYFGVVLRPPDAERFLQEEFKPCFLDAIKRVTKDAPGTKET